MTEPNVDPVLGTQDAIEDDPVGGIETVEENPEAQVPSTEDDAAPATGDRAERYRAITGLDPEDVSEYDIRRTLGEG